MESIGAPKAGADATSSGGQSTNGTVARIQGDGHEAPRRSVPDCPTRSAEGDEVWVSNLQVGGRTSNSGGSGHADAPGLPGAGEDGGGESAGEVREGEANRVAREQPDPRSETRRAVVGASGINQDPSDGSPLGGDEFVLDGSTPGLWASSDSHTGQWDSSAGGDLCGGAAAALDEKAGADSSERDEETQGMQYHGHNTRIPEQPSEEAAAKSLAAAAETVHQDARDRQSSAAVAIVEAGPRASSTSAHAGAGEHGTAGQADVSGDPSLAAEGAPPPSDAGTGAASLRGSIVCEQRIGLGATPMEALSTETALCEFRSTRDQRAASLRGSAAHTKGDLDMPICKPPRPANRAVIADRSTLARKPFLGAYRHKQEEDRRQRATRKNEHELDRRLNPKSISDFQLLYSELQAWHARETRAIKDADASAAVAQAALAALLKQETRLLQTIDRMKQRAAHERKAAKRELVLRKMSRAKRWSLTNGRTIEVETPQTARATALMRLYAALSADRLSVKERLAVLLHVKWTVKEFDCTLTREIVELIEREADLLNRGRSIESLTGLRSRTSSLFLTFAETPEFNPAAVQMLKAVTNVETPPYVFETVYPCHSQATAA